MIVLLRKVKKKRLQQLMLELEWEEETFNDRTAEKVTIELAEIQTLNEVYVMQQNCEEIGPLLSGNDTDSSRESEAW